MKRRVIALALVLAASTARAQEPARMLVVPFENASRDGRLFWLTEASAVLVTDELAALDVNAVSRQERQSAFERLQVPPAVSLTVATCIRIGQIVGATHVVLGSLQMEDDALVVRARSIALDTGRIQADATDKGPLPEIYSTFERLARTLVPEPAKAAPAGDRLHPPVAVFEDYIKGLLAETPATAITYFTAALKRQPAFDPARLALWNVYADEGDHEHALASVEGVSPRSPDAARARFLAGLSQINLGRYDRAFETFTALAGARTTAAVLNNLGVIQLRRGASPQTGQPTYYFTKAADGDPRDADYAFNLGYAYWQARGPQAAVFWLREAIRRRPADGDAHFVLGAALAAIGSTAEAARERELARHLSATYEGTAAGTTGDVPKGLERVKNDAEPSQATRIDAQLATSGQRDQQELARFYLDRGRRLFAQNNDREAADELSRALYLSPYLAEAHVLSGRVHLRNGRVREAIDAFKVALWSEESAEAHAALGEAYLQAQDPASAHSEAERALLLDPASADATRLLHRLDAR